MYTHTHTHMHAHIHTQELLQFVAEQGVDLTENELITQFPRRSISALGSATTFKAAGLTPRETVIIHPVD